MIRFSRSRKGSILDLIYIVIGFFTVAVIGILVSSVVTRFNNEYQSIIAPNIITTDAYNAGNKMANTLPNTLNGGLLFLFFGACLVALILASLVVVHPIFFIFYILELCLLIIFSGGIADAFQVFIESTALATEHSQYPTIIFMFHYLPFIIGIIGFILAAIMYKVRQNNTY